MAQRKNKRKSKSKAMLAKFKLKVRVRVLPHGEGLPLPEIQSDGAAGLDLVAAVPADDPLTLRPGKWALVPTGLTLELPKGAEAQVRPRSGLAMKHGVTVLNSPGTIDSDYRGEVQVLLINLGGEPFRIARGERIAQMVVAAHARVRLKPVKRLSGTTRGAGGFGSTGKSKPAPKAAKGEAAKAAAPAAKPPARRKPAATRPRPAKRRT